MQNVDTKTFNQRFDESEFVKPDGSKVFLDDLRSPPDNTWILVVNYKQAIKELEKGDVETISLDHDLGMGTKTGYDVLKWIEEKTFTEPEYIPPTILIHTSNPSAEKIMSEARNRIYDRASGIR